MHTQRARMCITVWLPNEVLTEIVRNARKSDQATICRVSKLFYALALPILNRDVVLRSHNHILEVLEAFSSSMMESPVRADSVRSLTFIPGLSYSVRGEELLVESLKVMRRLEHLCIDDSRPHGGLVARLGSVNIPNLSSCSFMRAYPDSWEIGILQFLSRNPTITHLYMYDAQGDTHIPDAARTTWTRSIWTSSLVEKLAARTGPCEWVLEVLGLLSTHMPRLKGLQLRGWERDRMTTALAYFALNHDCPGLTVNVDEDREALKIWANASPTLRGCCIDEVALRQEVGDEWEECSRKVLDAEAGFADWT
ncbi:hypothetical protein FB45DRAFT_931307 [Roridomyces roridus]|uniref:F-box domain-containing protein n=1 Tax=Roridomyces roridus TaxID=1738132 RepID=A0AAD7FH38_9AGAR|nr:hypothetical protein FB45DRAFT_931307 [Roridomyces roridus]